jgi:hypothetical protein
VWRIVLEYTNLAGGILGYEKYAERAPLNI